MYYAELINFESLETVIEIRDADHADKAAQLVKTYVISEDMADRLIHVVFMQLQFYQPSDNKGLFIVGNYGTGKSHLMAVISSLAENAQLVQEVKHPQVAQAAQTFAGRFYVLRMEIGATTQSLRNIITSELENYLDKIGVHFKYPASDVITNNKVAFELMMTTFEGIYPDLGLLLVVDELLEYLRSRKDQELVLDLSFLREIGEVCKNTRFRFIAGIQETIFDNPRFSFVASSLRRVKDRFEQILITRKDIKFVVTERLLQKNDAQLTQIRGYLTRFAPYYTNMSERLEEFCHLFPVHPDYLEVFEHITLIEKREILKTLERECKMRLPQPLPAQSPDFIAYDSYWQRLRENPSFRSLPEVRDIIECSQVLENRIQQAFTYPLYKPLALRIVHALSVHRLTTHDLYAPVGVTAQELKDTLCLYQEGVAELGGNLADDLLSLVETVLQEILKTVNRQFISTNSNNGQYYLDLKKNYDFDALIEKRTETLENHQLDRSYYIVLKQLLELSDYPTGVNSTGCLTWNYELEWRSHRVTRLGLLVFGAPNERPTATASRDFYLYFLQPYDPPSFPDGQRIHELFFRFTGEDNKFARLLRNYTATTELTMTATGTAKTVYESKLQDYLKALLHWLQTHLATVFQVTHQGRQQPLLAWLKNSSVHDRARRYLEEEKFNYRDLIDEVANLCLDSHFHTLAPQYPIFPFLIAQETLPTLAQEAIRSLHLTQRSRLVQGLLQGLQILEDDLLHINVQSSPYTQTILHRLYQKPAGQVLNRTELLAEDLNLPYFAPDTYRLEPELLMVLLVALVYTRDIVLTISGHSFEATNFEELTRLSLQDLLYFRHLERPKDFSRPALKALFTLLQLPAGLDLALTQNDDHAMRTLHTKIRDTLHQLVQAQQILNTGLIFWGQPLLQEAELHQYRNALVHTKTFLESLQAFSNPSKFKHFRYPPEEIQRHQIGLDTLQTLLNLQTYLVELSQPVAYLTAAAATLPADQTWLTDLQQVRAELLPRLADPMQRQTTGFLYQVKQQLATLQQGYLKTYLKLHTQTRLGVIENQEKTRLKNDYRWVNLKKLATIDLLPQQPLRDFEQQLTQLQTCFELTEADLHAHTLCPHCGFQPLLETAAPPALTTLAQLNKTLRVLHSEWTQTLLTELKQVALPRSLLKPEQRTLVENFLTQRSLPEHISPEFIEAVQESLAGLLKVVIKSQELYQALSAGGAPAMVTEIRQRFEEYMTKVLEGKEGKRVRIILE